MISIATAPSLLHDRRLVQDRPRWRGRQIHAPRPQSRRPDDRAAVRRCQGAAYPAHHCHHLHCYHMVCSPQGRCSCSAWTTPQRHSPGQYVQTPGRARSNHWSSRVTWRCSSRISKWLSGQVFPRYAGLDAWDLGDTPSPRSDSSWRRRDADVSTPPSQTPTPNPTATTLQGNASTLVEPWLTKTTRWMPLSLHELSWQEKTPGRLGITGRRTHHLRTTRPRNLRSCES